LANSRYLKKALSALTKQDLRQEGIVNNPLTIPLFQFISKLLTILPFM